MKFNFTPVRYNHPEISW